MNPVRLGLIGFGNQMRQFYWRYIEERAQKRKDVHALWISEYLPQEQDDVPPSVKSGPHSEWHKWLDEVDAVVVSLPNHLHAEAIERALRAGKHVAVDKPTAISSADVKSLCALAAEKTLLFVTLSQRRYEELYLEVAKLVRDWTEPPFLIQYLIAHDDFGAAQDPRATERWELCFEKAGGGVLIGSAYHGIDTVFSVLRQRGVDAHVRSVSADWIMDTIGCKEHPTEAVCNVRVNLEGPCLFSITASRWSPARSIDENMKIFGRDGCIRVMRDLSSRTDQRAASLTYQRRDGTYYSYDTTPWGGKRWAPLEDFINGVSAAKAGQNYTVHSPAQDSILTLQVIEQAYRSAGNNTREAHHAASSGN